jgi:predicted Zn-dependent protease
MSGHDREAVEQFRTVLKLRPSFLPARLFLGAAYLALKEPANAVKPLEALVRAQPDNKEARLFLGEALLALERAQPAAEQFDRLSKLDPENPKAWNGLGLAYEGLANASFEELEKIAPGSAYWLVLIAEARFQSDQYNRAFFFYRQALAKMPNMRGVHDAVAEIYRKAGHPDWGAIEANKEQESPPLDCGGALGTAPSAVESSPNFATTQKNYPPLHTAHEMECEFWSHSYRDVVASSSGVKTAEGYFWRTRSYNELARIAFSRLGQLAPSGEMHELMAKIQYSQKNYHGSAKEWRQALELSPGNSYYQQELAISLAAGGAYGAALPLLKDLFNQSHDSAELDYWLGSTLLGLERAAEAIPFLEKAVQGDPTVLQAHRDLARAYSRVGQEEKAIPHLTAALPIDEDGSLYYQLARAYRSLGKQELEKEMLKKFKELQTSSKVEGKALELETQITPP